MIQHSEKICPACGASKMRSWHELDDEQKFTVEHLPKSAEYTKKERHRHCFCSRCWFEDAEATENLA